MSTYRTALNCHLHFNYVIILHRKSRVQSCQPTSPHRLTTFQPSPYYITKPIGCQPIIPQCPITSQYTTQQGPNTSAQHNTVSNHVTLLHHKVYQISTYYTSQGSIPCHFTTPEGPIPCHFTTPEGPITYQPTTPQGPIMWNYYITGCNYNSAHKPRYMSSSPKYIIYCIV